MRTKLLVPLVLAVVLSLTVLLPAPAAPPERIAAPSSPPESYSPPSYSPPSYSPPPSPPTEPAPAPSREPTPTDPGTEGRRISSPTDPGTVGRRMPVSPGISDNTPNGYDPRRYGPGTTDEPIAFDDDDNGEDLLDSVPPVDAGGGGGGTLVAVESFTESIAVQAVDVEVFVADRSGRPVTGLAKDDFELFEDGKPVAISNFYAQTPAATSLPASQRLDLGIFLDDLELTTAARHRALAAIQSFVAARGAGGDRVLLATFDGSLRVRQAPSGDAKALAAALDELAKGAPRGDRASQDLRKILSDAGRAAGTASPGGAAAPAALSAEVQSFIEERFQEDRQSLTALDDFIGSLAGLPGRKAVLFVSGGVSLRPGQVLLKALGSAAPEPSEVPSEREVQPLLDRLVQHANAGGVTLYGLGAPEDLSSVGSLTPLTPQAGGGAPAADLQSVARDNLTAVLGTLANFTGGFAGVDLGDLSGLNDTKVLLDRLRGDLEAYYSLGFTPARPGDLEDHVLGLRLKGHDDLAVRTRGGYRDRSDAERLTERTLAGLYFGVEDNPLDVRVALESDDPGQPGKRQVALLVAVPAEKLLLLPVAGTSRGRLSLFVGTHDADGRTSPIQRVEVPFTIPDEAVLRDRLATYRVWLNLRPEVQTVAVGVRDEVGQDEAIVAATYRPPSAPATAAKTAAH